MLMRKKTLEILDMDDDLSPKKAKSPKARVQNEKIGFQTVMNVRRITQTLVAKS